MSVPELYADPLRLDACSLQYVHIDERGDSVTLGFDTGRLPDFTPLAWEGKSFNTFQLYLLFQDVFDLTVSGWGEGSRHDVRFTAHDSGRIGVTTGSPTLSLSFDAATVALSRYRFYLASESE